MFPDSYFQESRGVSNVVGVESTALIFGHVVNSHWDIVIGCVLAILR